MRKSYSLAKSLIIFILAQLLWLALVGLWIYWYISNYLILEKFGEAISPQSIIETQQIFPFIGGLILLVGISIIMVLIFRHLSIQIKLTSLYDNFIANISHELKSPLSSIQLYLETLKSRNINPEKQKEFIEQMISSTTRLERLIDTILEISTIESNRKEPHFTLKSAKDFLPQIIKESFANFNLPESSLSIVTNGDCPILVEEKYLKMVFNNLIDNSIKYNTEIPEITVEIKCNEKEVVINFTDNGIGIEPNEQKNIFKKFYRINDKDSPNVKGSGLGLYWCKEIFKKHKGKIDVFSEGRKKGTTFKIILPAIKKSVIKEMIKVKNNEH